MKIVLWDDSLSKVGLELKQKPIEMSQTTLYLRGQDICEDRISVGDLGQGWFWAARSDRPNPQSVPATPPQSWGTLQSKIDRLSTQPQRVLNLLM
ncbi:hypothetical protein IQ270_17740 [Microcoleus sp. LEGE 07076]|uniref:hypothetical protein n=1 Tax=Microcoleus sp. LEGE 07076 TaxID=915322 RepID=UPI00187EC02D|nr:hypothetical protein [Microcoleus sp. LEGE 07076]MBE9186475.1 hypothetical protein [Microcoleus sp. LEGE 07076]